MGFDTVEDALTFVEQLAAGTDAIDINNIGQQLRDLDVYLQQTLKPKGRNEEARKHVEAGRVTIEGQTETLSQADKHQRGIASAAAAAALYFEDRRSQVLCLWYLLQSQVLPEGVLEEDAQADWDDVQVQANQYTKALLRDQQDGRRKLLHHLLHLIQAINSANECLVYACQVEPDILELGVVALVKLLHNMARDFHGLSNQAVPEDKQAQFQHTYTVLIAFLSAILPPIITQGVNHVPSTAQETALGKLAHSADLKRLLEDESQVPSGFHAVLKLAWGVMLKITGDNDEQTQERAQQCMHAACKHGVLHFLHTTLLDSHCFGDEQPEQQQLYASVLHRLLIQFLNAARSHEVPALLARCKEVDIRSVQSQQRSDSLSSLLHCLATCYRLHPDLWLNDDIKPDIVVPFMNYLGDEGTVLESPSLLVAWLDLLTGMASRPKGASTVFGSLSMDASGKAGPVSWMRMLLIMREYCNLYSQQPDQEQEQPQQARQDCLAPPEDVAGLSAFLRLFSQVFRDCDASQVEGWMTTLEDQSQIRPLWEVFFQLMCHPVPQALKAGCDEAIAVLVSRTGQASAIWERLLAAVVVAPSMSDDPSTGRYDISYQLAEIESRAEDYSETLALVRLLNALWKASGPSIYDGGRGYAHFSVFVLESVLAPIGRRQYKSQTQKWDLFAACLQHLQLVIAALQPGMVPSSQANGHSAPPPGLSVMLDLLRDGAALRAVMHLVDEGVEHALEERSKPWGAAREGALLAALRVLVTALQTDTWLLQELRQYPKSGQYTETLDAVLKHDSRRISKLVSCLGYTHSSAVQVEAIRLTHLLAARQPTLADMLVQQRPNTGTHDRTGIPLSATWPRLRFAFADCLQRALTHLGSETLDKEDPQAPPQAETSSALPMDTRAVLILELLLAALSGPAPTLTHLLMGFEVTQGPDGVYGSRLDPHDFSCLGVVLNMVLTPTQPHEQPLLYEQCLQLLYSLSEHLQTRGPMLTLLRQPPYSMLAPQIRSVLQSDEPGTEEESLHTRVARLHQRACLVRLAALDLHCADPAVQPDDASCKHLLRSFFLPFDTESDTDEMSGDPNRYILYILQLLATSMVQQPEYVNELSSSYRQSLRDMGVDAVLQSSLPVDRGGVLTRTRRGQLCYDMSALTREMKSRYMQTSADHLRYSSEGAEGSDELREACRQGLRFAQKYNAWLEEAAALQALVQAWQQLVAVAITKRFGILQEVAAGSDGGGPDSALQLVHQLLSETLYVLHGLLLKGHRSLVLPLAQVPAATVDLFLRLLEALDRGQSEDALRPHLYAALLSFMQYTQGRRPAQASPQIFAALLKSGNSNGSSDRLVAGMDQQNRVVEQGIAASLVQQLPLLTAVVRDAAAQTSKPALKAQALTLLASWVVADPSLAVGNQLHQQDLPNRILEDLVNRAHHFLPGPHAGMAVQVIEAQLTLLLRLSSARRSSSAEVTDELQLIGKLIHCKAIDLEPEEPVLRTDHKHDRRRHISRVLLLVLQVVNSEVATKQQSPHTMSQAVAFVAQHSRMMHRVLREAAVGNLNGWEPGEREAELATLVLCLVTRLSFSQLSQQPGAPADALRDGAHRLLGPFSCPSEDSHSPLLRTSQQMDDRDDTDLPSTSYTQPLKVLPCPSNTAFCSCTCLEQLTFQH
ncbi:hypothetical protein ABBQ38_014140 [Trebouxia sp. C0009 RCD-2024]